MKLIDKYKEKYFGAFNGKIDLSSVEKTLEKYSVNDALYKVWLTETNGGPISSDWYDSIDELEESQIKLKEEPWTIEGFVIGWDGAGNPIVMSNDETIMTEDHNFGGHHKIAENFKDLLKKATNS